MPKPAPSSHPSSSAPKKFPVGAAYGPETEHTRRMYDILELLLFPFISKLLRWMYQIVLLCSFFSIFLWLFQFLVDIQHLVSTGLSEQLETPQVDVVTDTVNLAAVPVLLFRCLSSSLLCPVGSHLVSLYPLSSLLPLLVQLLFSRVFPWQVQLFSMLRGQPDNPQLEVEIFAACVVLLQCLQFIFCRERFRRNRWVVQWGAWAAFYAPLPLAAFSVGVMLRFGPPYWLVAVFFAAGQADSMAAYSLEDDKQKVRRFAKGTLMLAYLIVALMVQGVPYQRPIEMYSLALGFFVFFVHLKITRMKMIPSSDICMVAAEAMRNQAKGTKRTRRTTRIPGYVVAVGSLESRRTAMSGCTIYQDIEDLNYSSDWKDVCLSSAMFLQLLQSYNTSQVEVVINSSRVNNRFFRNLEADKSTKAIYARAFKIVEVELSFLYDYFFSTHGSPSHTSYKLYHDYHIFKLAFLFSILSLVHPADKAAVKPELGTSACAICALILLELFQLVGYLTSNWLVVSFMCDRADNLQHTSWLLWILGPRFTKGGHQERSGQNELGQYALVEDFDRTPMKQRLLGNLLGWTHRRTPASPVALSEEIKRSVFRRVDNPYPIGWTLISHHLPFSWTVRQATTEVQTILIWHIATWMCSMYEETIYYPRDVISWPEYEAATKLSRYCAYLLAFKPKLLPGHHTVAESTFDKAVKEAELFFKGKTSPEDRYKWMKDSYDQEIQDSTDEGILKLGMELGRQLLEDNTTSIRWDIMANFWIDMMLHVAQSCNVTAHIEHLAKGGEFVTHLWALLSNAGMQQYDFLGIKQMKDDSAKSEQAYQGKGKARAAAN